MEGFWKTVTTRWQDSINFLLGLWLILSPWALGYTATQAAFWNAIVLGLVIGAIAIAALVEFREWEEWLDMALGAWLVISPWLLGFGTTVTGLEGGVFAATWNFVVVGVLTIALAAWSLAERRQEGRARTT